MIEEEGSVLDVADGRALVRTRRTSACEGCSAKGACSTLGGGKDAEIWVDNPIGALKGERVVVAVPEGAVIKASLILYLAPTAAMVAGAALGNWLGPKMTVSSDAAAAIMGCAFLVLAFAGARIWGGRFAERPRIAARLTRGEHDG